MRKKLLHREKGRGNECLQFRGLLRPMRYRTRWWIHNRFFILQRSASFPYAYHRFLWLEAEKYGGFRLLMESMVRVVEII